MRNVVKDILMLMHMDICCTLDALVIGTIAINVHGNVEVHFADSFINNVYYHMYDGSVTKRYDLVIYV